MINFIKDNVLENIKDKKAVDLWNRLDNFYNLNEEKQNQLIIDLMIYLEKC